jgi:hypothetical protein
MSNCMGVCTGNHATFVEPFMEPLLETIVRQLIVWAFVQPIIDRAFLVYQYCVLVEL